MNHPVPTVHSFGEAVGALAIHHAELLAGHDIVILDEASFEERIGEVEVLLCHAPPAHLWARASRLRLIQTVGVGLDALLPAPELADEVAICNASGLSATTMGEFALTQLLMMLKRFPEAMEHQRQRSWAGINPVGLKHRTVAVLGTGMVGREVARLLAPFGCRIVGVTRRARPIGGFDEVFGLADLHAVLRECDDIVIALPALPDTTHLIDAEALTALRPGGHVVNVARGELMDETALLDLLRTGHLAGAALDTVAQEPLPEDDPLWSAPGAVITPHVSWVSHTYTRDVVALFADNVAALEQGEPLANVVDRRLGYHPLPD